MSGWYESAFQHVLFPLYESVLRRRNTLHYLHEYEGTQWLGREQVAVLVSKDSGGAPTAAKLDAARELGVRVIMVHRPPAPDGVPEVGSTVDAVAWLAGLG